MTEPPSRRPELDALARWFTRVFADLDVMNADFCESLERGSKPEDDGRQISRRGRDGLRRRARRFLDDHPHVDGAGMIFSRTDAGKGRGVIEWWQRDGNQGVRRYTFGLNPAGDRFYDYENLEWFVRPFGSGQHSITGPYIDYLGVDKYVVTLTAQSIVHGRPVGVAAIDITLDELECQLLPLLKRFPKRAAIVSSHGSVLVSNTSSIDVGDRIDHPGSSMTAHELRVSGSLVTVLYE